MTWLMLAILLAAPAHASPEDPYGSDYIAMAINPVTGEAFYGVSGTQDNAVDVAMTMCQTHGPCVVAQATQHGCVAVAFDPVSGGWAGGRGADDWAAMVDASSRLPQPISDTAWTGGKCSE